MRQFCQSSLTDELPVLGESLCKYVWGFVHKKQCCPRLSSGIQTHSCIHEHSHLLHTCRQIHKHTHRRESGRETETERQRETEKETFSFFKLSIAIFTTYELLTLLPSCFHEGNCHERICIEYFPM